MSLIGIIGGTGVCDTTMLKNVRQEKLLTFFGMIHYLRGTYKDKEIVFLPRHGRTHSIPPHLINYRANIFRSEEARRFGHFFNDCRRYDDFGL